MKRRWIAGLTAIFATILVFASCGAPRFRPQSSELEGRILLWHAWSEAEGEALNQALAAFTNLHPDVLIKTQRFAGRAEMEAQYAIAVTTGLGPDIIVLPVDKLPELVQLNGIDNIERYMDEDTRERYPESVLQLVRLNDRTYGLPTALNTMAIYYNRARVENPTNTLSGLIEQASQDTNILLPTNFYDAAWGIQAFGGELFNEEGMVILDQGGFANWLAWLRESRSAPGMIQDTNRDVLRQRFLAGDAGYYFGYARELSEIRAALGAENVGVVTLPAGPIGSAGPFLSADAFFFSTVSSSNQRRIAIALAKFITNAEQSARLMRTVSHVPANQRVRINQRLNPIVATFAAQARAAIPRPTGEQFEQLLALGNEAYVRALESEVSPVEVALSFTNDVNEANGFPARDEPSYACTDIGTIRLYNTWEDEAANAALKEVLARFNEVCPLIIVQVNQATEEEVRAALQGSNGQRTTFALVDQSMLLQLTGDESLITNLTPLVAAETLQRFWPSGLDAMRLQGNLYGLPLSLRTYALYYNRALVSTPAQVLEDFRIQAAEGVPITLDTRFERAFWGIGAFGDQLFNEAYRVVLGEGFANWLIWLRESRDVHGIQLTDDGDALLNQFLNGETAYYVGTPDELARLQDALGPDLGVALLPQGPAGSARPLVRADGFVFRASASESNIDLARETVRYATDVDNQTLLMNEAHRLPVNATVTYADGSPFAVFAEQAQSGYVVPNTTAMRAVERYGDAAYTGVLAEGRDPLEVVAEVVALINEANDLPPLPEETPTAAEPETADETIVDEEATTEQATTNEATTEESIEEATSTPDNESADAAAPASP